MLKPAAIALLSHWRRTPGQLLTLVLGLALATGLWSAVQAINAEARASYDDASNALQATPVQVLSSADGTLPLAAYVRLRRAGWLVTPVLEGAAELNGQRVTVMGVDILNYPALPVPDSVISDLSLGAIISGPGQLFANPETASRIGGAGDSYPVAKVEQIPPGVVLTDIGLAETLLDMPGKITRILVLPEQPRGLVPLAELVPDLVLSAPTGGTDAEALTDSFHLNLAAFGFLSFAVGLFVVHGTIGLAFQQRRAIFRTLRALGLPQRHLTVLVLGELLALALIAGSFGLILGYLVAAALLPDVAATLRGLYGAEVEDTLTMRPEWVASGLAMSVAGTALAAASGVWRVARMPILESPGLVAWSGRSAIRARRMAFWGAVLLAAGLAGFRAFPGLTGGFALLGGLLLAAALVLPAIVSAILTVMSRLSKGPVAQWLWADMRAQLPGLSLALMALLLALAANIGVGTMVSSFRLTFTGWLDQRLAPELYVTAASDRQGARIAAWLEQRTDAVLPIRYGETVLMGQPARLYGAVDHATYRDHWPMIAQVPEVWDLVRDGRAALINEQLARRANLWPGDTVTLMPGWDMTIGGVYSDYGNPAGQARVSMRLLLQHAPNVANRQFAARVDPRLVPGLIRDLRATFSLPANAVFDQSWVKTQSLAVFDKTFVVTGALNVLTLGVAGFAILTALLTLWSMRLPQVAPVWAMGLTRSALARLELTRSLLLAGLTAIIAIPLGLVLAWVLLTIVNVDAFGWKLPVYLFPLDWVRLILLSLLAGGVAAAIPARRLNRVAPSDLLRVFANER